MLRAFFVIFAAVTLGVVSLAGFRGTHFSDPPLQLVPDMKNQPKVITQHFSRFFQDGRSDHQIIQGTIPIGYSLPGRYYQTGANNLKSTAGFAGEPTYLDTGVIGEYYGDGIPLPITKELLSRGKERFEIHCAICHDRVGSGAGIIKNFGLATIASLQDDRIRAQPDGQIFSTITNGKNTMGAYGPNIAVEDRWAIVAHVRVLQISQGAKADQLLPELRNQINSK